MLFVSAASSEGSKRSSFGFQDISGSSATYSAEGSTSLLMAGAMFGSKMLGGGGTVYCGSP